MRQAWVLREQLVQWGVREAQGEVREVWAGRRKADWVAPWRPP